MSHPVNPPNDSTRVDISDPVEIPPFNQLSGWNNGASTCHNVIDVKVAFADKEQERRRVGNKRYREKKKVEKMESIAQRLKRSTVEQTVLHPPTQLSFDVFPILSDEINCIIKYNPVDRISEASRRFRWVKSVHNSGNFIMQYEFADSLFTDLLYCSKSLLNNAGYGLFAAQDIPKCIPISIYLGRIVKVNDIKRSYLMQLNRKYVKKTNTDDKWERIRKNRPSLIVDGLESDDYHKWTIKRQFYLSAHLMNDINYKNTVAEVQFNCVVQPLLEVITSQNISKGAELYISYNR